MQHGPYPVDYEDRPYNPDRMRRERVERAQASLRKHGLGAVVLFDYDYHRYLGYYSFHQYARRRLGHFIMLIEGEGFPYVPIDHLGGQWEQPRMPWFEGKMVLHTAKANQLMAGFSKHPNHMVGEMDKMATEIKSLLQKHGKLDMPCGIDISNYNLIEALKRAGVKVCDGNIAMCDAIMVKTEDEIHCLRRAGVIVDSAHWEVAKALRPGMTEYQIAGVAANACYKLGAEELEGPSFVVCTGERSGNGVPNMPTDRVVRPGDLVVIDINGVSFQGYRSCYYRTFCVGDKPTEFQKEVYKAAYEGVEALAACVKPGKTTEDVQRDWLKLGDFPGGWGRKTKWPDRGRHYFGTVGHSIGLRSGDPGLTIPGTTAELGYGFPAVEIQKNMTFAVECGCFTWQGNRWARDGVKIENCGVVTDEGFESFYRFPYKELITCGLPGLY